MLKMTSSVWTAVLLMAGFSYVMSETNVVEVYFVVAPEVVRNYLALGYNAATAESTIKTDINYYIFQMNQFFGSLSSYGLSMEIRAKKVTIMTADLFKESDLQSEKYIYTNKALDIFHAWLISNNAYSTVGYDLALIYTGYDLFGASGSPSVAGVARGATCTEGGLTAVEYEGTMSTAITTAHEIGHSLGAPHVNATSQPCSSPHDFIMTPTYRAQNDKRWFFSSCTATAISNFIKALGGVTELKDVNLDVVQSSMTGPIEVVSDRTNCLTATTAPAPTFKMEDFASADILDATMICQRNKRNVDGYYCTAASTKGDDVCKAIWCGVKKTGTCTTTSPSDGMICDNNKRCDKGSCVASSIPTGYRVSNCVYGDTQSEFIGQVVGQTCEQYLNVNSWYNCDWLEGTYCCHSCADKKTNITGCEWGDRNKSCGNYNIKTLCSSENNKYACCKTCHGFQGKRSVSSDSNDNVELQAAPATLPQLNEVIEENDGDLVDFI